MSIVDKENVLLLFSGGIDSTTLLYWLMSKGYIVKALHINYGQKPYKGESNAIANIRQKVEFECYKLSLENMREIGSGSLIGNKPENISSHDDWFKVEFFPNRNLILLAIATAYAKKMGYLQVAIGITGLHSYEDTSKSFISDLQRLIKRSLGQVKILAPFAGRDRSYIIQQSKILKVPLVDTFSCNAGEDQHCCLCSSCLDRFESLNELKPSRQD